VVDDASLFVLVVVAPPTAPRPSAGCSDVDKGASAVVSVVDSTVCELDVFPDPFRLVVVLISDCAIGVVFDGFVVITTPGLAVGKVTESAAVG